jgi:hypothetical protein
MLLWVRNLGMGGSSGGAGVGDPVAIQNFSLSLAMRL